MFYEYHVCAYIDLNIKGNQQHLKKAKKDQEEVLDQEALKEDQNIRKDINAEIGHTAGKDLEVEKDQVAMKKDQVAVNKDQEDQKNIDQ